VSKMISFARLQVGKPYVFGASGLGNTLNDQVRNLALRVVLR
jgi:cell wall-associated NlpC family hydrolase